MENKFIVEVDKQQIIDTINKVVSSKVQLALSYRMKDIEKSINQYFEKSFMSNNKNAFENALDYTVEASLRRGLEQAMKELNFKELVAVKSKEILSSDKMIHKLAEAKVRQSLGLPKKE